MLPTVAAQPFPPARIPSRVDTAAPQIQPTPARVAVLETYSASSSSTSSRVEIRGHLSTPSLSGAGGVQAYQAVQATQEPVNPFAKTILTFIDAQIRRDMADGASADELKSRLQAGLKGFEEGYGDAFKQLSESGLLDDQLRGEIEATRTQVLAGIQQLADELGVEIELPKQEMPATVAPVVNATPRVAEAAPAVNPGKDILSAVLRDIQIIEQYQRSTQSEATYQHLGRVRPQPGQTYAYGIQESRNFSLKLRTADGDSVTIGLSAQRSGYAEFSNGNSANGSLVQRGAQSAGLQFSVEGELDEGELRALTDLLRQVGDISAQFFRGDLESAFQLATELSFDGSEIASFDLNLHMRTTEAAGVMEQADKPDRGMSPQPHFEGFVASVMRAGDLAERLGQPRSLVADLLEWVANQQPQDARGPLLASSARHLL